MKSNRANHRINTWVQDLIFLVLVLSVLLFVFLGSRPLWLPDEARYAEVAREMVVDQDNVTPHLNGIMYFEKPILFYWLTAAAIKMGGVNLWAVRTVNALLGLWGCLMAYVTGRLLYGRRAGLLAGLMLGTSVLYFLMAHFANMDLSLTVFLSTSLFAFILAMQPHRKTHARRWLMWGSFAASALAVLTKGLIGIVFPAFIVGAWLLLLNEWRLLKKMYLPSALFIFFIIVLPWYCLIQWRHPEFFHYFFVFQHFQRYTTLMAHHSEPVWYFIPVLILGFFPWIVFLPQALISALPTAKKNMPKYRNELFFILWAALIFIFFSFSQSKLMSYILPVIPALVIIIARYLSQAWDQPLPLGIRYGFGFLLGFSTLIAVVLGCIPHYYPWPDLRLVQWGLYLAASVLVLGSFSAAALLYRDDQLKHAMMLLIFTSGLFLTLLIWSLQYLDTRSIRPLVQTVKPLLKPTDEIVSYHKYYYDLSFYLERRITEVGQIREFDFGMRHQEVNWVIPPAQFWRQWRSSKHLIVFMNRDDYAGLRRDMPQVTYHVLGETMHDVAITNQP